MLAPVLRALALSAASFIASGAAGTVIGSITCKIACSTIAVSDNRLADSSDSLQLLVGVSASAAGAINTTMTETFADAIGLPTTSGLAVAVGEAASPFDGAASASISRTLPIAATLLLTDAQLQAITALQRLPSAVVKFSVGFGGSPVFPAISSAASPKLALTPSDRESHREERVPLVPKRLIEGASA